MDLTINQTGGIFVRSLSVYALIGAALGLWVTAILMAIAVPAYSSYLLPWSLYHDLPGTGAFLQFIGKMGSWMGWIGISLYVWLWFLVAGRLNPSLSRLPFAREGKPLWAWAAWIGGGLLFIAVIAFSAQFADAGLFGMGGRKNVVILLLLALAAAGAWVVVSPRAFGRFGGNFPASLSWPGVAGSAGLGVLFAVLALLMLKAASAGFSVWFTVLVEALDRSSEASLLGSTWLMIGMTVLFAVAVAIVFGLLPVFVPGAGSWRKRLATSRPALILVVATLVVAAVAVPLVAQTHLLGSKKLVEVANLSGIRPLSLRHIKLCLDRACRVKGDKSPRPVLMVDKPIEQVSTFGFIYSGGNIPLHPDTVAALEKFVVEKGKYSVLRKSAIMGTSEIYKMLWQPLDAYRTVERFVAQGHLKHGSILWTQIELAWLANGSPISAEARKRLEALSDDKRYFIGHRAAVRLATAWARFGNMPRAQAFLDRARKAQPGKYDHVKLVRADLANGRISGRLAMPGGTDGIRVGLFRVTKDPTSRESSSLRKRAGSKLKTEKPRFPFAGSIVRLTDSAVLSGDGRFSFGNLGSGEYYLALLVPADKLNGKDRVVGNNVPDLIRLNAPNPRRDLGVFRLTPQ